MLWGPLTCQELSDWEGVLDTRSWQVILMSSISPIRPVINNSTSARPTQTDKCTRGQVRRVLTRRVMGISADAQLAFCLADGMRTLILASQLCTAGCYLVKSKLYHLLSLAHCWLRIWKAVTKFICAEQEQIAWSRCYKGDKTKVAPSEGSSACVCILSLLVCACRGQASHILVFFLQKQMDRDTKERRWWKNGGENTGADSRSPTATTNPWPHLNIVPSVTKQANTFPCKRCDIAKNCLIYPLI